MDKLLRKKSFFHKEHKLNFSRWEKERVNSVKFRLQKTTKLMIVEVLSNIYRRISQSRNHRLKEGEVKQPNSLASVELVLSDLKVLALQIQESQNQKQPKTQIEAHGLLIEFLN